MIAAVENFIIHSPDDASSNFSPTVRSSSSKQKKDQQPFVSPAGSKRSKTFYENHQQESDYKNLLLEESAGVIHPRRLFGECENISTPDRLRGINNQVATNSRTNKKATANIIFDLQLERFQLSSSSSHKIVADERRAEIFAKKSIFTPAPYTSFDSRQFHSTIPSRPTMSLNSPGGIQQSHPTFFSVQKHHLIDNMQPSFSKQLFQEDSDGEEEDSPAPIDRIEGKYPFEMINTAEKKQLPLEISGNNPFEATKKKHKKTVAMPSPLFSLLKDTANKQIPKGPLHIENTTIKATCLSPLSFTSVPQFSHFLNHAISSPATATNQQHHNFTVLSPSKNNPKLVKDDPSKIKLLFSQQQYNEKGYNRVETPSHITEEPSDVFESNSKLMSPLERLNIVSTSIETRNTLLKGFKEEVYSFSCSQKEEVEEEEDENNRQSSNKIPNNIQSAQNTFLCAHPSSRERLFTPERRNSLNKELVQSSFSLLHKSLRNYLIEQQNFNVTLDKAFSQFPFSNRQIASGCSFDNLQSSLQLPSSENYDQHLDCNRFANNFTDIQLINANASAAVYKSKVNGQVYAVKSLSIPLKAQSEEIIKEVESLVKLSSFGFGLLRVYNVWAEDGKVNFTTEHCLENLLCLRRSNVSEQLLRQVIHDVCESLQFLHEKECAHLCIKPENILLTKQLKFVLADLGIAKFLQISAAGIESQDAYIAPELLIDTAKHTTIISASAKADIFSLGAILYELMIDNSLLLSGEQDWKQLRCYQLIETTVNYSTSLKNLVKSMLSRDPLLRPTSENILSILASEDAQELELNFLQQQNQNLEKRVEDLTKQLLKQAQSQLLKPKTVIE